MTPIGICMEYYEQRGNFIHVRVNDERVKIYDNGKATLLDAAIHAGFSQNSLFPSRGAGFTYTVNGESRVAKGKAGEAAEVLLNGKETNLNELIKEGDAITIRPATKGEDASMKLGRVLECRKKVSYKLFGKMVMCPKRAEVNGKFQSLEYYLKEGDEVIVHDSYSVAQLLEYMGMEQEDQVLVNGVAVDCRTKLKPLAAVERIVKEKGIGQAEAVGVSKSRFRDEGFQHAVRGRSLIVTGAPAAVLGRRLANRQSGREAGANSGAGADATAGWR